MGRRVLDFPPSAKEISPSLGPIAPLIPCRKCFHVELYILTYFPPRRQTQTQNWSVRARRQKSAGNQSPSWRFTGQSRPPKELRTTVPRVDWLPIWAWEGLWTCLRTTIKPHLNQVCRFGLLPPATGKSKDCSTAQTRETVLRSAWSILPISLLNTPGVSGSELAAASKWPKGRADM
jgi:hypothetical protein